MNGTAEFGIGVQLMIHEKAKHMQWTQMLFANCDVLGTRMPIKVSGFSNLILPFPAIIWGTLCLTVTGVSMSLLIIHRVLIIGFGLGAQKMSVFQSFFNVLSSMTQPLDLSVLYFTLSGNVSYNQGHTVVDKSKILPGRGLALTWIVASFFITLFYSCNLRAVLISPAFESPIDYPEDVIERGATMYIPSVYRLARFVT